MKVLIIEDSKVVRQLLKTMLKQLELEVVAEAEDGLTGLELAMQHKPDIITVDLHLPKVDGLDIIKYLKKANAGMSIIVISSVEPGEREESFFRGADAVIDKPFKIEQLQHVIERLSQVKK